MDASSQQFCLRWNNHQTSLLSALPALLYSSQFTDVTLSVEGRSIRAHRIVLCSCSAYFLELFGALSPLQHPVVVLPGGSFDGLSALVTFMYSGEVNIYEDQLSGIISMAELLGIKGLADVNGNQSKINLNFEPAMREQRDKSLPLNIPNPKFYEDFSRQSESQKPSPLTATANNDPVNLMKISRNNLSNVTEDGNDPSKFWNTSQQPPVSLSIPKVTQFTSPKPKEYLHISPNVSHSLDSPMSKNARRIPRKVPESRRIEKIVDLLKFGNTKPSSSYDGNESTSMSPEECITDLTKRSTMIDPKQDISSIEVPSETDVENKMHKSPSSSKLYATCFICHKQLSNQYNLRVHLETHQNVQYACAVCSHVSRSKDALRKHVSYRHPGQGVSVDGSNCEPKRKRPMSKLEIDLDNPVVEKCDIDLRSGSSETNI